MHWLVIIFLLVAAVMFSEFAKLKDLRAKNKKARLAILKEIYEQTGSWELKNKLADVADLIINSKQDMLWSHAQDTTAWWKERIEESDQRFVTFVEKMASANKGLDKIAAEHSQH